MFVNIAGKEEILSSGEIYLQLRNLLISWKYRKKYATLFNLEPLICILLTLHPFEIGLRECMQKI